MEQTTEIQRLRQRVEATAGFAPNSPKEFLKLADEIFLRLGVMLSPTTLKRIWGYLDCASDPRSSTLDILARFVGYSSWEAFIENNESVSVAMTSNLILQRHFNACDLEVGDRLQLAWLPDHGFTVKALGGNRFEVVDTVRSTLAVGDVFSCNVFIEGEPLYVDHLTHDRYTDISYVAGKHGGIRFQLLDQEIERD